MPPPLSAPQSDAFLARVQSVTSCTAKRDKYDRYLAAVFLTLEGGTETFLNNAFPTAGHAVVKRAREVNNRG